MANTNPHDAKDVGGGKRVKVKNKRRACRRERHTEHRPGPTNKYDNSPEDNVIPPDADQSSYIQWTQRIAKGADSLEERDFAAQQDGVNGDYGGTKPYNNKDCGEDEGGLVACRQGEHTGQDEGKKQWTPQIPVLQSVHALERTPKWEDDVQGLQSNVGQIPQDGFPDGLIQCADGVRLPKLIGVFRRIGENTSKEIHAHLGLPSVLPSFFCFLFHLFLVLWGENWLAGGFSVGADDFYFLLSLVRTNRESYFLLAFLPIITVAAF